MSTKKTPAKPAVKSALAPNTSAPESPAKPADVSATQPVENTPPAGAPVKSLAVSDEVEKLPPAGGKKHRVLSPLDHNGKRYEIDEEVELDADIAEQLIAGGVVAAPV